jgi:hypothetical protein
MYKDFKYIDYVLDLEFKEGYTLYKQCIDRINEKIEKDIRDKYYQMFLIEIQNGYTGSFDDYYKTKRVMAENYDMTYDDKISEEQRILNNVNKLNDDKFIQRR